MDSSIYGALVRLAQPWVMRYPLIDFHGSMGNRDGDGPAAHRYTEARLSKITEDGMLRGINKNNVDFIPNYSETKSEPVTLPALFPNLLCNPNLGIGVSTSCNWAPHNLGEVAQAIYDYLDGKEPILPGPDFPTGGMVINKNDIPSIMETGHGSVKIRGKYKIEGNNIVFYEIPYAVGTEDLMNEIGKACDDGLVEGIKNIRNETNRKSGFRLVIECEKKANISAAIKALFKHTNLQSSFSYNQVALIGKTPVELNLKDCIKIYVDHNKDCIKRETEFDIGKTANRLEIVNGLLKALEDIDNIIYLIKKSESAAAAKTALMNAYGFTEAQAKAIVDMKLGRLAGLEKLEIENEKAELIKTLEDLNAILNDLESELRKRLNELVKVYGDERRTELCQINDEPAPEKVVINKEVEPEKCVVIMTQDGAIKRIPQASFRTQRRNTIGLKTQDDITLSIIRTNTIDSLIVFTNQGNMYRLLVNDIPTGTNTSKGALISELIEMQPEEKVSVIYSIYYNTDSKYIVFVTKQGIIKKTELSEYAKTNKKTGMLAIKLKENDSIVSAFLMTDEDIIIITEKGYALRLNSDNIGASSRVTIGVKGISLYAGDNICAAMPIRDTQDKLGIFVEAGLGKTVDLAQLPTQARGGHGVQAIKLGKDDKVAAATLLSDEDTILIAGNLTAICISATEVPACSRIALGNIIIKNNRLQSVSKI